MPAIVTPLEPPPPLIPRRKRWTREECQILVESGTWEIQKLELINGELISKMGQNRPHVNAFVWMMEWLLHVFGPGRVNPNTPIDVAPGDNPINEPEPDLIALTRPSSSIRTGNVQPGEIALLVEISDTSLYFDLAVKAPLYSRAGIVEYWVLDVGGRRLIVHRDPAPSGYGSIIAYSESESIAPLAAPQHSLSTSQIFAN